MIKNEWYFFLGMKIWLAGYCTNSALNYNFSALCIQIYPSRKWNVKSQLVWLRKTFSKITLAKRGVFFLLVFFIVVVMLLILLGGYVSLSVITCLLKKLYIWLMSSARFYFYFAVHYAFYQKIEFTFVIIFTIL